MGPCLLLQPLSLQSSSVQSSESRTKVIVIFLGTMFYSHVWPSSPKNQNCSREKAPAHQGNYAEGLKRGKKRTERWVEGEMGGGRQRNYTFNRFQGSKSQSTLKQPCKLSNQARRHRQIHSYVVCLRQWCYWGVWLCVCVCVVSI